MDSNDTLGRIPLIGDKAPDFKAKTTDGWLTLSEYGKDSWVLLFS
ncbi:MAG: redoxin domain-containing protein, partial [Bacteroidia bacterium]|nr:redoxin domain-containing protein [Bacteroidia bacterium]